MKLYSAFAESILALSAVPPQGVRAMGSKNDDFFGGMFDFNGDGKTDLGEEFLAY